MSMLAVRVAKRQWATTADPGIFSQIVICLFASGYLRYIVLQYVGPDTWRISGATYISDAVFTYLHKNDNCSELAEFP